MIKLMPSIAVLSKGFIAPSTFEIIVKTTSAMSPTTDTAAPIALPISGAAYLMTSQNASKFSLFSSITFFNFPKTTTHASNTG